jgi:hypothetical protein
MDGLNLVSFFFKKITFNVLLMVYFDPPVLPPTKPHLDTFLSLFAIELSGYSTSPYQQQYMY